MCVHIKLLFGSKYRPKSSLTFYPCQEVVCASEAHVIAGIDVAELGKGAAVCCFFYEVAKEEERRGAYRLP